MDIIFKRPDDTENGPICGVVVTAMLTGKTFKECYEYYRNIFGERWKGDITDYNIKSTLIKMGVNLQKLSITGKNPSLGKMSMMLSLKYPKDVFLVFTRNHVQLVHNTYVADQNEVKKANNFWARRRIVTDVFRVKDTNVTSIELADKPSDIKFSRRKKAIDYIFENKDKKTNQEMIDHLVKEFKYGRNTAVVYVSQILHDAY